MSGTTFLGKTLTEQDILKALRDFDATYPDINDYDSWLDKKTYKYAVQYRGKRYPPKYILRRASVSTSDFSGGEQTNRVFRALGFVVGPK